MSFTIRLINSSDIQAVLDIYSFYISETSVSFETEVPNLSAFQFRIQQVSKYYPWIVYEKNKRVLGYAYACAHRIRSAYQWSADVAIYVDKNSLNRGIGKSLYNILFKILRLQGVYNAYAGITLPNPASIGLHESFGFKKTALYNNVGYKLGSWHNVGWWQLSLKEKSLTPAPLIHVNEINTEQLNTILTDY